MSLNFHNDGVLELLGSVGSYTVRSFLGIILVSIYLTCFRVEAVVTIEYHADTGTRNVVDSTGNILSNGNEVRVGCFKDNFNPANEGNNIAAVADAWMELNRTTIQVLFNEGGRFYGNHAYTDEEFTGKTLCIWILKTINNEPVFKDYSNVKEYGIFSAKIGWRLPEQDAVPPANYVLISSSEVELAYFGSLKPNSLVLGKNAGVFDGNLSLSDWRKNIFPNSTEEALKADMADPDQDGLPNVLEYYLGTNPMQKDANHIEYSTQVIGNAVHFAMTFKQAKNRTDMTATVLGSSDLARWQSEGMKQEIVEENDDNRTVRILVPVDVSKRFFQLILKSK